ncbi:MAG: hypothetical protein CL470_03860 [Acidimicrobiaceae bacterium]|nr:hypothetical protein [Acidimicrobiaceae bacterium]
MEKYCNNCGNYGHVYKSCRHPILSYGILLYHKDDEGKIRIVMVERKDSLSYIEFLRGKYKSIHNLEYLELLFSRLSNNEKKKLVKEDFDTLWKDLWIHTETINQRVKREYSKSKETFNKLKEGILINQENIKLEDLIHRIETDYHENEWEIPKGRRKNLENNRECAIREFSEETNICSHQYNLYNNIIPLIEEYTGINGVRYKHVYYIGEIKDYCKLRIDSKNKDQYTEVKNIQWLTEEECYDKIREYDTKKRKVIEDLFSFLRIHHKLVIFKKK